MDPSAAASNPAAYLAHLQRMAAQQSNNAPNNAKEAAAAAAAGGQPAAPPPEDAVQDGGDAIDTFSSYIPTALPVCIVDYLRSKADGITSTDTMDKSSTDALDGNCTKTAAAASKEQEVIELSDSEDELEIISRQHNQTKSNDTSKPNEPNISTQQSQTTESKQQQSTTNNIKQLFTNSTILQSHTSPAVESALLSSVSAPTPHDSSADVVLSLVKDGKLSLLQAEGVCLAVGRFGRVFCDGGRRWERAGFFIGDGAGIGKGRQISAILLDAISRNHGKGRHLWISVSRELVQDAKRDLTDIGCHVHVHDGAEVLDQMSGGKKAKGLGAGASLGKGVLFITYSLLVSGKRVEDIIAWLANTGCVLGKTAEKAQERTQLEQSYSGCIIFDEAHKAKNLEQDTRTAKLVLALQERLPNARVLYCSATGVSDIKHMVYATRLGLWGAANPLYPTFESFNRALAKRGVGAQEMLALEMKRKGIFLARTLSWDGAEFHTMEVNLNKEQIAMYDGAVRWWLSVKAEINAAVSQVGTPKLLWRAYWSAHQRFFKEMCICSKIDEVVAQAKRYLENNDHAIVIGLQSTGEAGMEVALEELAQSAAAKADNTVRKSGSVKVDYEDMTLAGLVSTCASIMTNFVRNHFPVAPLPPEVPKVPPIPPNGFASEADRFEHARLTNLADRIANEPPPAPIPHLKEKRNMLLESILDLALPPNPLDDIIDRLGGAENVAEMTGRTGRILRQKNGKYKYVKRFGGPSKQKSFALSMPVSREDEQDRLNIVEKRKFIEGKKSVAIISDAASTGISLHADQRCQSSHKRRVHFTIELPWAADKAIQQLGRSHRAGQVSAPIYKMVVTELGGERRFASAVSKRMASMGALTKGDRRAASGSDLSEFDVDSNFGKRALARTFNALQSKPPTAPARNTNAILDKFIALTEGVSPEPKKKHEEEDGRTSALSEATDALIEIGMDSGDITVKKFLNRIAGLDVARQNLVFSLFMATLDDVITDAKATGEFEGSVEDIRATSVALKGKPEVIAMDTSCEATTELTRLVLDRGISFDSVIKTIILDSSNSTKPPSEEMSTENKEDVGIMSNDDLDEKEQHCKSGFYLSRRKVAGRYLIAFAQRKNEKEDSGSSDFIDLARNLMIITRPNTGKNPCEMASDELRYKYKLVASVDDIMQHLDSFNEDDLQSDEEKKIEDATTGQTEDAAGIVREKWGSTVADVWDDAYHNSNHKDHNDGLAPRISEIGLITGAVLHVLPSLEKAVQFMSQGQRALRVMRAEISDSGERIVGIKFPITESAIERLMIGMKAVADARRGSLDSPSFVDEAFSPIDGKSKNWATAERKTMKSFFEAKMPASKSSSATSQSSSLETGKRKETGSSSITPSFSAKKPKSGTTKTNKITSLTSFFGKKST